MNKIYESHLFKIKTILFFVLTINKSCILNDTNVLKLLQEMKFIIILVWISHNVNFPLF
jgi:hypothetical protein